MHYDTVNYDDNFNELSVLNELNKTNLDFIGIYGLFGRFSIEIPFDKQVNIYIGENGLGKTTILNIIYFILAGKLSKLSNVHFDRIVVKFKENREYNLNKNDIAPNDLNERMKYRKFIENKRNELYFDDAIYVDGHQITLEDKVDELNQTNYIINNIYRKNNKKSIYNKLLYAVKENITDRIIYLPTYRRIEDDFTSLNIRSEELNNQELLIRFGMSDVQSSIERILDKIRSLAMKGFTEMTGVLLKEYTDGVDPLYSNLKKIYYNNTNIETVKIVFDRVGDEIEEEYKRKILKLIESGEINSYQYQYLLNLINKLVDKYKLQKAYDDRIKKFANTCNKYFNGKHFYYNQSTLNLNIYLDSDESNNKDIIELTQLSSGEKQIVSLFSKIYLESNEPCIVIVDEPELSLSIQWQKMLLPDIMRSNKCNLLITVTHSPFIFENEFDFDAKEIKRYIKISE